MAGFHLNSAGAARKARCDVDAFSRSSGFRIFPLEQSPDRWNQNRCSFLAFDALAAANRYPLRGERALVSAERPAIFSPARFAAGDAVMIACRMLFGAPVPGPGLRARCRPFRPALLAFAAAWRDDIEEIIAAVAVGDFVAGIDVLDGAKKTLCPIRCDSALGRHE